MGDMVDFWTGSFTCLAVFFATYFLHQSSVRIYCGKKIGPAALAARRDPSMLRSRSSFDLSKGDSRWMDLS